MDNAVENRLAINRVPDVLSDQSDYENSDTDEVPHLEFVYHPPEQLGTASEFLERIARFRHGWIGSFPKEMVLEGPYKVRTAYPHHVQAAFDLLQDEMQLPWIINAVGRAHRWYFEDSGFYRKHGQPTRKWEILATDLFADTVLLYGKLAKRMETNHRS